MFRNVFEGACYWIEYVSRYRKALAQSYAIGEPVKWKIPAPTTRMIEKREKQNRIFEVMNKIDAGEPLMAWDLKDANTLLEQYAYNNGYRYSITTDQLQKQSLQSKEGVGDDNVE